MNNSALAAVQSNEALLVEGVSQTLSLLRQISRKRRRSQPGISMNTALLMKRQGHHCSNVSVNGKAKLAKSDNLEASVKVGNYGTVGNNLE